MNMSPFLTGLPHTFGKMVRITSMKNLKQLLLNIVEPFRGIARLPWAVADFFLRRKQRAEAVAHERERLDRIRNPSKYLGK